MEQHDVVVVGAGVMGLASAWALGRSGHDVVCLEQFAVGHTRGSSHGSSRIFRFAYDEPDWVRRAQEALPLWRELEAESGLELLSLPGSLDTGRDATTLRAALEARGAEYELLQPHELARRFSLDLDREALFQPQGGVAWAARALDAFRGQVAVREHVQVRELRPASTGIRLETTAGSLEAGAAVVAAGAWSSGLLQRIGIDLPADVTRETVAYFRLGGAPAVPSLIDWDVESGQHAYSLAAGPDVLKVGLHHSGVPADPEEPGEPDPSVVEHVSDWVRRTFRSADPEPVTAETCLYTSTADERFVLEPNGPIVLCSACSGHGFKFAPEIGVRVAELVAEIC